MGKTVWRLRRDHGKTKAIRVVEIEAMLEARTKEVLSASSKQEAKTVDGDSGTPTGEAI